MTLLLALLLQITAIQKQQVFDAANKLMPSISWKQNSVTVADFTCRGRQEQAILGTVKSEAAEPYAILAVFLDGLNKQPELIRDSVHVTERVQLTTESLDYSIEEAIGTPMGGFERSQTCKGLNLADGETDSIHIYWDHSVRMFFTWRL